MTSKIDYRPQSIEDLGQRDPGDETRFDPIDPGAEIMPEPEDVPDDAIRAEPTLRMYVTSVDLRPDSRRFYTLVEGWMVVTVAAESVKPGEPQPVVEHAGIEVGIELAYDDALELAVRLARLRPGDPWPIWQFESASIVYVDALAQREEA